MKIRLGYVALPLALHTTSSSTVTYQTYQKLGEKAGEKLDQVILSNFDSLKQILNYNKKNQITFFRMTSNLIPLGTHPNVDYEIFKHYQNEFLEIGNLIEENNMRMDMHPDQFCVLNSSRKEVVDASINMLEFCQNILDTMQLKSYLILHIGGKVEGKEAAIKRFKRNFKKLNSKLQQMIILENDDKVYNILDTLTLCEELKIPMVLDYHHYICNHDDEKLEDYIERIWATWNDRAENPKIHFSSPKNKKEIRSHHDYIDEDQFIEFLKKIQFTNQDIDVMIEAKMKEEAMFRLLRQIRYKTDYKFQNFTTFFL